MKEITVQDMMRNKKTRLFLFSTLHKETKNISWQNQDTPENIVKDLIDQVDNLDKKSILVLFNSEIVEYLIHNKKIDPKNIIFAIDSNSELEAKYIKAVYNVDYNLFAKDLAFIKIYLRNKTFDVVFSNPPNKNNIHLKILQSFIYNNISKQYVIIHPVNWLIDLKGNYNLFINFKNLINKNLKSVKIINWDMTHCFYPCVITNIDYDYTGDINVDYFGDKYTTNNVNNITKYGKFWDNFIDGFYFNIKSYIKESGSIWDHNKKEILPNKEYCKIPSFRGHESKNKDNIYDDDFYTLISKDNLYIKNIDDISSFLIEFDSLLEIDNFLNYVKTDFARFCLSLFKTTKNNYTGQLDIIPWLDFTQEWDDEKLFKHFNISQEIQDYIRGFLPDYYGIRK